MALNWPQGRWLWRFIDFPSLENWDVDPPTSFPWPHFLFFSMSWEVNNCLGRLSFHSGHILCLWPTLGDLESSQPACSL